MRLFKQVFLTPFQFHNDF